MKINENMNIFTIRKKILLTSKLIGVALIVSYVLSTKLPVNTDISFIIWQAFVVVLICAIDLLMARFITKPVSELNEAARNMAELNFSNPCHVKRIHSPPPSFRSLVNHQPKRRSIWRLSICGIITRSII